MTEDTKTKLESCDKCGSRNTFTDDPDALLCQSCIKTKRAKKATK